MTQITTFSIFSICASVFVYVGLPILYGVYLRMLLRHKSANVRSLVLTFDDGPGNRLTPIILHVLNEHKAKATFFLLGKNIPGREGIVRQIAEQGQEIGSHGYDHLHYWKVSPFRTLADIRRGWKAIDTALGIKRRKYPFRPPYGKLNIISLLYLLFSRIPVVYWSIDSGDTRLPIEEFDSGKAASLCKESGGGIILAHDFDRSDSTVGALVIESLRQTLAMAKDNGMQILTVSELLNSAK